MGYMLDSHGFSQCNRVELSAAQCSVNLRPLALEIRVCNDLQLAAHVDRCEDTTYGALLPRRCDNHCRCTDFCLSGLHDCRGGLGVIFHEDASFCTTWPPARCVASCYSTLYWRDGSSTSSTSSTLLTPVSAWPCHSWLPASSDRCCYLSLRHQSISIMSAVCASSSAQVGQLHNLQTPRTDMVRHKSMNPEVAG